MTTHQKRLPRTTMPTWAWIAYAGGVLAPLTGAASAATHDRWPAAVILAAVGLIVLFVCSEHSELIAQNRIDAERDDHPSNGPRPLP